MSSPPGPGVLDLLLVAPPLVWGQEDRVDMKQPLNLLYLAGWLNHKGLRARIHDVTFSRTSLAGVLTEIERLRPRAVGVPFYQATHETAAILCNAVRARFPAVWLIAGGPLATTDPQTVLACPAVDLCVIGEGEQTTEALLRGPLAAPRVDEPPILAGSAPTTAHDVAGIALRRDGRCHLTPPREPLADLDALPYLDYRLIDIDGYFAYHRSIEMSSWLFLTTSRGCHARCTFCATPVLWPGGLRRQSARRILDEIAHQRRLFPQAQFAFMDDSFFADKAWLAEFFTGIATMNVRYCCIGRADHLREQEAQNLDATGCIYVALGIETGNADRQKKMKKFLDLDRARASVRLLAKHQVFCKCFFMLGFPDETPAEMAETINFAVELKCLGMNECNFFPVSIYPGTELAVQYPHHQAGSTVYQPAPAVADADPLAALGDGCTHIGEAKLRRYANIPKYNVNMHFSTAEVLEIVKLAYGKVDRGEMATAAELLALKQ